MKKYHIVVFCRETLWKSWSRFLWSMKFATRWTLKWIIRPCTWPTAAFEIAKMWSFQKKVVRSNYKKTAKDVRVVWNTNKTRFYCNELSIFHTCAGTPWNMKTPVCPPPYGFFVVEGEPFELWCWNFMNFPQILYGNFGEKIVAVRVLVFP